MPPLGYSDFGYFCSLMCITDVFWYGFNYRIELLNWLSRGSISQTLHRQNFTPNK